jgi:hypothetical protein
MARPLYYERRECSEGCVVGQSVIPASHHDLSVTTEHESAAIESSAKDVSTDPSQHG